MNRKMRRILVAAAAAGVLLLTACSSEKADKQQDNSLTSAADSTEKLTASGAAAGDSTLAGFGSGSAQTVSGIPVSSGSTDASAGGTGNASNPDEGAPADIVTGTGESEDTVTDPGESTGESGVIDAYEPSDTDRIPGEFDGVDQDAPMYGVDIWTGTYESEEESVTLTYLNSTTLSFSFAQSGISGQAAIKGYQAVYKGDDHYVVAFTIADDILEVTVGNEEDYDALESPLIGTYRKA